MKKNQHLIIVAQFAHEFNEKLRKKSNLVAYKYHF